MKKMRWCNSAGKFHRGGILYIQATWYICLTKLLGNSQFSAEKVPEHPLHHLLLQTKRKMYANKFLS